MGTVGSQPRKTGMKAVGFTCLSIRLMLVAFIALTCVSCSLFPEKELSGNAEERPKVAQGILTSLNAVNNSLETLYTSVARGLDEQVLTKLDSFVVETSEKSSEPTEQAELIKTGLDLLVDLKASRVSAASFEEALDSLRVSLKLFNLTTLQFLQTAGRYPVPDAVSLTGSLGTADNTLARALYTFTSVARRAGLKVDETGNPTIIPQSVRTEAVAIEQRLKSMKPETFLYLQPYLALAVELDSPLDDALRGEQQQLFALAIFKNGLLLVSALQVQKDEGQIDTASLKKTLSAWSLAIQAQSVAAAQDGEIPTLPVIPEKPPLLDEKSGALPTGTNDWVFELTEKPTLGSVDLSKNPPEYTPTSTSQFSIDRYGFRACFKMIPTFCTSGFSVVVQTPVRPFSMSLKTEQGVSGQFRRGDTLICSGTLQNSSQTPVYRWTLVRTEPTFSADITTWERAPGELVVPNAITPPNGSDLDVREGDKITCEVAARDPNGLQSPFSSPSLAASVALNSPASDLYVAQSGASFAEDVSATPPDAQGELTCQTDPVPDYAIKIMIDDLDSSPSGLTIDDCDGAQSCPFEPSLPFQEASPSGRYCAFIKHVGLLNFEQKPFYDLTVRVVDAGAEDLSKTIRIAVSDRNDSISAITPFQISETENRIFEQVLSAVDEDCSIEAACQDSGYTYTLAGDDASYFEIDGRTLRSKAPLNFEQLENGVLRSPNYSLSVTVEDGTGDAHVENITVTVADENEAPSTIVIGTLPDLSENATGGAVWHSLSITDPDQPFTDPNDPAYDAALDELFQNSVTYTLTVADTTKNLLAMSGRNIIFGSDPINYEEFEENGSAVLNVTVTATDSGGKSVTENFSVIILDINENPTNIRFAGAGELRSRYIQGSVPDDPTAIPEAAFLPLVTEDPDGDTDIQYVIVEVNGLSYDSAVHPFVIDGNLLKPTRVLNYSVASDREWSLTLRATDQGGLASPEQQVTVALFDITLENNSVAENLAPNFGKLCVKEGPSPNEELCNDWTYEIVSSPVNAGGGALFGLNGRELVVNGNETLDFEAASEHAIVVKATRVNPAAEIQRQFIIQVTDVNEDPTAIIFTPVTPTQDPDDTSFSVIAGLSNGETIGELAVIDPDGTEYFDWVIKAQSADAAHFSLEAPDPDDTRRRVLKAFCTPTPCQLPTPANQEFQIRVVALDKEESVISSNFVFRIVNYPEVSFEGTPTLHGDIAELTGSGLPIDVRVDDVTGTAGCVKATGDETGIHVVGLTNPTHAVIAESGISVAEKESGSGYKVCTLTVVPNENAAGSASFDVSVKSSTSVGVISSQTPLNIPVSIWRKPELRCPSRISLPVGTSFTDLECGIVFNDASAPADRSAETVSVTGCDLTLSTSGLTGSMPSAECTATVTASGVVNSFSATNIDPPAKTITLIPRRFGTNGHVRTMARNPTTGDVFLGGDFTAVDPIPASGMTVVDTGTAEWASRCNLTEGFNGTVRTIVHDETNNSFLVGGDFTQYRGAAALRLLRLNCSGEPSDWFVSKGFDGPVYDIQIAADGSVLVGGTFDSYGNETNGGAVMSPGFIRLAPNGIVKTAYPLLLERSTSSHGVYALAVADTTPVSVWLGGEFPSYNGDTGYKNLVRIDLDTGANGLSITTGINDAVQALAATSGGVYAGGKFTTPEKMVALFNNDGSKNADFSAESAFQNFPISSLHLNGSSLFVGASDRIAKLSAASGTPVSEFGVSGVVSVTHQNTTLAAEALALTSNGTHLFAGGRFTEVNPEEPETGVKEAKHLVKLDLTTGAVVDAFDTTLGPNDAVHALALFDSNEHVAVAGEFSALQGTAAGRLAGFSPIGVFNVNLNASLGSGFNGEVKALQLSGNDLYVGGAFTQLHNGIPSRPYLVKLVSPASTTSTDQIIDTNFDTATDGGFDGEVRALAFAPDDPEMLFVGGAFSSYRGNSKHKALVRISSSSGAVDTDFDISTSGFTNGALSPAINALLVTPLDGNDGYSVFAGGQFSRFQRVSAAHLVKIDNLGSRVPFGAEANAPILSLALSGETLFAGGEFTEFSGLSGNVAALNATDGAVIEARNLSGVVRALALLDNELWAAGSFVSGASSLARMNTSLELLETSPSVGRITAGAHASAPSCGGGVVTCLHALLPYTETVSGQSTLRLLVSGFFSLLDGLAANNVVRLETTGSEARVNPDP